MRSKEEVERFLEEIRIKVNSGVLSLLYLNDREKNVRALLNLEIPANKRTEVIPIQTSPRIINHYCNYEEPSNRKKDAG